MKLRLFFTMLLLACGLSLPAAAQTTEDISVMRTALDPAPAAQHKHFSAARQNRNIIQSAFSGLFLFYKRFISSQDGSACSFSPSCSEYALVSIKKKGLIVGVLSAFDRLSRCNGMNRDQYDHVPFDYHLHDPVE